MASGKDAGITPITAATLGAMQERLLQLRGYL